MIPYASPIAAAGRICAVSQPGVAVIYRAGDTLDVLARNALEETVVATPAIVEGGLYLRTAGHLFAFRNQKGWESAEAATTAEVAADWKVRSPRKSDRSRREMIRLTPDATGGPQTRVDL